MATATATVSSRFQVVIPREVREVLELRPNDTLLFLIDGNNVYIRPRPQNFTRTLRGLHREVWDDPDQWLERERATWE